MAQVVDKFMWLSQTGWTAIAALAATLTLITAAATALYARGQLRNAREVRDEQTRPYVTIDIEPGQVLPELMDLVLRNIGQRPAFDVSVRLDPTPSRAREQAETHHLADMRILNDEIPMLAPGREIRVFFDNFQERIDTDLPTKFEASVTYRSSSNLSSDPYNEKYPLDLDIGRGSLQTVVKNFHDLAVSVEGIAKTLAKSGISDSPIQVIMEDRKSFQKRREEMRERARNLHNKIVGQMLPGSNDKT